MATTVHSLNDLHDSHENDIFIVQATKKQATDSLNLLAFLHFAYGTALMLVSLFLLMKTSLVTRWAYETIPTILEEITAVGINIPDPLLLNFGITVQILCLLGFLSGSFLGLLTLFAAAKLSRMVDRKYTSMVSFGLLLTPPIGILLGGLTLVKINTPEMKLRYSASANRA